MARIHDDPRQLVSSLRRGASDHLIDSRKLGRVGTQSSRGSGANERAEGAPHKPVGPRKPPSNMVNIQFPKILPLFELLIY
jgi:hypothetical protein